MSSELGEIAKELIKESDYGTKPLSQEHDPNLELKLGDAYYSLLELANTLNVDLETALKKVLEKYEERGK